MKMNNYFRLRLTDKDKSVIKAKAKAKNVSGSKLIRNAVAKETSNQYVTKKEMFTSLLKVLKDADISDDKKIKIGLMVESTFRPVGEAPSLIVDTYPAPIPERSYLDPGVDTMEYGYGKDIADILRESDLNPVIVSRVVGIIGKELNRRNRNKR